MRGPDWPPELDGPRQVHTGGPHPSPEHIRHPDHPLIHGTFRLGRLYWMTSISLSVR